MLVVFDLAVEIDFSMVFGPIDSTFCFFFRCLFLLNVWILQVIHHRLRWLLWMLIVIRLFVQNIETGLGLPFSLACLFLFHLNFILVHKWEGKRQMFFRISVEVGRIVGNMLAKLLLLELPDVHLLISIWVNFDSFRNFDSLLQWSTCVHVMYSLLIRRHEIDWYASSPVLYRLFESRVASDRVWVSLPDNFFLILRVLFFILPSLGSICYRFRQAFPAGMHSLAQSFSFRDS